MWLFLWSDRPDIALVAAAAAGVFFGLSMAVYYRHGRRKHSLPEWGSLAGDASAPR